MNREQLSHCLRAASTVVGEREILVIGSQSVLGTFDESQLPDRVLESMEVDIAFFEDSDEQKSDMVDGAIGELSQFHHMNSYYAQGVSVSTAILPRGWESRLIAYPDERSAEPAQALCLDPYDCVVSKLAAYREKDREFADALITHGIINIGALRRRAAMLDDAQQRRRGMVLSWIDSHPAMAEYLRAEARLFRSGSRGEGAGLSSPPADGTRRPIAPPAVTVSRCNAWMPIVKARCILPAGHEHGHRSRI